MILLDGQKLSQKILNDLKDKVTPSGKKLRLAVVVVGKNPVIEKFIAQKKKAAKYLGMGFKIYPFDEKISTNELRRKISAIVHEDHNTGVIVQLPLPSQINVSYILNSVTPEKDVDVLSAGAVGKFTSGRSEIFPPVAGAVKAFLEEYKIDYRHKNIVIVGAGDLVGKPVAWWLLKEKVGFAVVDENTQSPGEITRWADIVITGIGKPGYITGDWLKDGAVVIDAGTSESGGKLIGDVDFESISKKASYLTPVPGGVGPVTVAILFRNLVKLAQK